MVLTIPLPRPAQIFLARPLRGKRPFRGRVVNWMGLSFIEIAVIETIEQTVGGVWQAWYQADRKVSINNLRVTTPEREGTKLLPPL